MSDGMITPKYLHWEQDVRGVLHMPYIVSLSYT